MLLLALTTLEKLQEVPERFWINCGLVVLSGAVALILVRHAARMNRMMLALIVFLLISTIGFQWIWERNEPHMLTPLINKIAPFLPSKPNYTNWTGS